MKITKDMLKQLIREEINNVDMLSEGVPKGKPADKMAIAQQYLNQAQKVIDSAGGDLGNIEGVKAADMVKKAAAVLEELHELIEYLSGASKHREKAAIGKVMDPFGIMQRSYAPAANVGPGETREVPVNPRPTRTRRKR